MAPPTPWRLLDTGPADGADNMALDEAILCLRSQGRAPSTLRFYAWEPPCLSLGAFQSAAHEVNLSKVRALGFDLVRRPTGGRAILHQHELTYSLVAGETEVCVAGSVVESYRKISAALAEGLRLLGVEVQSLPWPRPEFAPASPGARSPVCFEAPSPYEITLDGRKLVGSAQLRRQGCILQHGSILLDLEVETMLSLFRRDAGGASSPALGRRIHCLREALGRRVYPEEVKAALEEGFQRALNIVLEPGTLTEEEQAEAERLRREKYGTLGWNLRR